MSTAYKVLIVDDEESVRSSLRSCLDWEKTDFQIIGEASNGTEALRLVDELSVDLVITDILMPEMDGLNFTELLKERHPSLPCIFISGFDNFEYAQRAIELRVLGFLLKPIDPHKLKSLLQSSKKILQQNESQVLERNRNQLNRVVAHHANSSHTPENFANGNYYLMLVSSVAEPCPASPVLWLESAAKELLAQQKITAQNVISFDVPRYPGIYGILFLCDNLPIHKYHHFASALSVHIKTPAHGNPFRPDCRIGVSYPFSSTKAVYPAFKQTIKNLKMSPFLNSDIYPESVLARKNAPEFKDHLASASESIRLLMQNRKFADAKWYIADLLRDENAVQFTPSSANSLIALISSQLSLLIALYEFTDLSNDVEHLQSPIYLLHFSSMAQWRDDMLRIIEHIESCFAQHNQDDLIRQIQKYLADNYASDWDLSELAALFYINSSYLSHIFKKKTGKTLSMYIEDLRIQNACTLLSNTDLPIGEIAAAVGYSDPNYFAKRFRKKVGTSPASYRKAMASQTGASNRAGILPDEAPAEGE